MDCDTCSFECSQMNIDKLLRAHARIGYKTILIS